MGIDERSKRADHRLTLVLKSGGEARFDVSLGNHPELVMSVGWDWSMGPHTSRQVQVQVGRKIVLDRVISAEDLLFEWHDLTVDLSEFSGQRVSIYLRLPPCGLPDEQLGFADPVILSQEPGAPT